MSGRARRSAARLAAMAWKETLHVRRDPRTLYLAIVMPVLLLLLFGFGVVLYFTPVYLTRLWTQRYYPIMTLVRPTEAVIRKSFPGLRSLFQ